MKNREGKAFSFQLFHTKNTNEHMRAHIKAIQTFFSQKLETLKGALSFFSQKTPSKFFGVQLFALFIVFGTFGVFFSLYASNATRSKPFTFQGQLFTNDNLPVADNTPIPAKFAIYSISSSNANISCLWATGTSANPVDNCPSTNSYTTDAQFKALSVTPIRGIFTVEMGDTSLTNMPAIPLDFQSGDYFMQVVINGEALTPRTRITSVPYAYNTQEVAGYAISGDISGTPTLTGSYISFGSGTFTDSATAAGNTLTNSSFHTFLQKTIAAQNTSVVTSNAYTLYLEGSPTRSGVNGNTITNSITFGVGAGAVAGGGTVTNSYGAYINAQTGAGTNYAGAFMGGNLGIGTASPAYLLDSATSGSGIYQVARLQNMLAAANNTGAQLLFAANRTTSGMTNVAGIAGIITDITDATYKGALAFYTASSTDPITASSERMRIDYLGNVGIGTTSPIAQLHVTNKTPVHLATISTGASSGVDDIKLHGRYAYLADVNGGKLVIFDVSNPSSPTMVTSTPAGSAPRSIAVQGKYVYLTNQSSNQLQIFDISNPTTPTSTGVASITAPRAVAVQGAYAYAVRVAVSNSMQIFDISNPSAPTSTGSRSTGDSARAIAVQGRYAYVVTGTGANSFQIFDVSNPTASGGADGNIANTGFDTLDVAIQGKYAYITLSDGATNVFKIYDISNPTSPSIMNGSGTVTSGRPEKIIVQGRYAYITNFGPDGIFQIFDISNPASPTLAYSITQTGSGGFRGLAIQGRFAYITVPSAGELRVFDLGGSYIQQLEVGGLEASSADIRTNLTVNNGLTIFGGVHAGIGGIFSAGSLAISASHANALSIAPFGISAGNTGEIRFMELSVNGTNYVGFKSPDSIATSTVWVLPSTDGISGQALKTNGSGVLSWTTLAGGSTPWSTVTGGIYYAGGKIGVGANTTPTALLTLTGGGIMIDGISQIGNWNTHVPLENTNTFPSEASSGSMNPSLAIAPDGLPVMAYYKYSSGDLGVLKCGNVFCSTGNTNTIVESTNVVGVSASLTIGADGFPILVHRDATNDTMRVVKCNNATCSSTEAPVVVATGIVWGNNISITIASDGLPIIAHTGAASLKVVKCGNASCSSVSSETIVDSAATMQDNSMTIGTDGYPVIAYYDFTNSNLKFVKCTNASCSSFNAPIALDGTDFTDQGKGISLTIGSDGLPVMSYYNGTALDLKTITCGNTACSSGNTTVTVDSTGNVGQYTSITIGTDNFPIISYYDATNSDLKVAKCNNITCTLKSSLAVDTYTTLQATSIAIASNGLPLIAYEDSSGALATLSCGNTHCIPYWTRR